MPGKVKTFSNDRTDAGFLLNGAPGRISLEQIVLAARPARTYAGTVLGKITRGAQSIGAVARVGNVGNGAMSAVTADAGVDPGVYRVTIIDAAANAGRYRVEDPAGVEVGVGDVGGAAFNGPINFALADGSVDFVVGDSFALTVAYAEGSGQYAPLDLAAINGGQIADGILYLQKDLATGPIRAAMVARQAEVNGRLLIWPAGISDAQKKAAEAQLAAKNIIVRY